MSNSTLSHANINMRGFIAMQIVDKKEEEWGNASFFGEKNSSARCRKPLVMYAISRCLIP